MELVISKENFDAEVAQSEVPVLVDFYADWCGPCKMMAPIVEKIAEAYDGKLKVGKCDVDAEGELAMKYRIMSIPAILIFKGGEVVKQSIGAVSQADLEKIIEEALA